MNNVSLIGRLTADPWTKAVDEERTITKFHIAVDRGYAAEKKEELKGEGKQTADFPQIVVWGKLAESCSKILKKGLLVGVSGVVQTSTYDTSDGDTVYSTYVNGKNIKFLEFPTKEED